MIDTRSLALIKITKSPYRVDIYLRGEKRFSINQNHQESVSKLRSFDKGWEFSINQNHQESVSTGNRKQHKLGLALIKITKSPYRNMLMIFVSMCLALIKITKSPYPEVEPKSNDECLALIKITKSPYQKL